MNVSYYTPARKLKKPTLSLSPKHTRTHTELERFTWTVLHNYVVDVHHINSNLFHTYAESVDHLTPALNS